MRNFYPGVHVFDLGSQIYSIVGNQPFTFRELRDAGIDIAPKTLMTMRDWKIVKNPRDEKRTVKLGVVVHRKVGPSPGVKLWVLTDEAIRIIQRYQNELEEKHEVFPL